MINKFLDETRILIVDDSRDFRMLLRKVLRNFGAEDIVEASSTGEALEHLGKMTVDLIISDHYMQQSTGVELLSQLRRGGDGINRSTPFIILTGEARRSFIIEAARNGVDAYIIKPISPQALEDKIYPIIVGERPLFDRWNATYVNTQFETGAVLI